MHSLGCESTEKYRTIHCWLITFLAGGNKNQAAFLIVITDAASGQINRVWCTVDVVTSSWIIIEIFSEESVWGWSWAFLIRTGGTATITSKVETN